MSDIKNQLSFITVFKKFREPYLSVQNGALDSWRGLAVVAPNSEVDTKGACLGRPNVHILDNVQTARDLGYGHQAPVIRDLLLKALPTINTPMVGFMGSDIILPDNFQEQLDHILEKYGYNIFLTVLKQHGKSTGMFLTSKYWWRKIVRDLPEFILGRFYWRAWLERYVEKTMPGLYFDATPILKIIHQEHDYSHIIIQEQVNSYRRAASVVHNFEINKVEVLAPIWPKMLL